MKTWRCNNSLHAIALTLLAVSPLLAGEKGKMVMLPSPDQCYGFRGRLDNSRIKIEREKKARVAFLGGSITEANGWRVFTAEMLQKRYPDTKFDFVNAGISSTDSTLAPFRLKSTVFASGPVDLLFFEFAVNDLHNSRTSQESIRGVEGIIRKLDQFTQWSGGLHIPWAYIFDAELKPGEHELTLRMSADKNPKSQGYAARILQFLAN